MNTPATTNATESRDADKSASKFFVGYDINSTWAVEAGYADPGKPTCNYVGVGALAGLVGQATIGNSSWFVAGKGTLPLATNFNLFGKLGAALNESKLSVSTNNAAVTALFPPSTKNRSSLLVGIDGEYSLNKNVALRLEFEDFGDFGDSPGTGKTKANMWSLGLTYKF